MTKSLWTATAAFRRFVVDATRAALGSDIISIPLCTLSFGAATWWLVASGSAPSKVTWAIVAVWNGIEWQTLLEARAKPAHKKRLSTVLGIVLAAFGVYGYLSTFAPPTGSTPSPTASISQSTLAGSPSPRPTSSGEGGWGPARPLFTMAHPAPYAVLNSITDNPNYGDERFFVTGSNWSTGSPFANETVACPGANVKVRVSIQNDVADSFADPSASVVGLTMEISLHERDSGEAHVAVALDANNAISVWDGARFACANRSLRLSLVPDSGKVYTRYSAKPIEIPDLVPRRRQLVGYKGLDGRLPNGYDKKKYQGEIVVYFDLKVEQA